VGHRDCEKVQPPLPNLALFGSCRLNA
jgi:hypothetical protein